MLESMYTYAAPIWFIVQNIHLLIMGFADLIFGPNKTLINKYFPFICDVKKKCSSNQAEIIHDQYGSWIIKLHLNSALSQCVVFYHPKSKPQ